MQQFKTLEQWKGPKFAELLTKHVEQGWVIVSSGMSCYASNEKWWAVLTRKSE